MNEVPRVGDLHHWQRERRELGERIEAEIPGLRWDRHSDGVPAFGGYVPWQGDGTIDGRRFYARFRHNQASLTIYEGSKDYDENAVEVESSVIWPYYPEGHPEHHEHTGAPLEEDIIPMMRALIDRLAPVSEENPSSLMILMRVVEALVEREKGDSTDEQQEDPGR